MALDVLYDKKPYVVWKTDLPMGLENGRNKFFTLYDRNWWLVLERNWNEVAKEETWHMYLKQISSVSRSIELRVTVYFAGSDKKLQRLREEVCSFSCPSVAQILVFGKSLVSEWCPDGDFKTELTFLFTFEVPLSSMEDLQGETEIERQSLELLSLDAEKMYRHRDHSDVVLKCCEVNFEAHRNVLTARSELFATILRPTDPGDVVPILDMQPPILDIFLQYLYCGKVSTVLTNETSTDLYQVAFYYGCPQLQSHCRSFLMKNLRENNVYSVFLLADQFKDEILMDAAVSFVSYFNGFFESATWQAFSDEQPGLATKILKECSNYKGTPSHLIC